jgi:chromosome partitioning protein
VSQKGRAGKTTLAIHLAVAASHAGMNTAVVDLDPQASSTKHVLEAARAEGGELAIIDTAPHSNNAALEAARMADVVLIPCRPSILDLEAIANSLDIAKLAHKPATVILNAVAPSGSEADEAEEAITQLGGEACPVRLVHRVAYARAFVYGQATQEYEPHGKAAQEIKTGPFQIPVDSFNATPGGGRMVIATSNRDDSSPSPTNQRQPDEVYQTPRFRSPDLYRDCQTGVAVSRGLQENDGDRTVLLDITDLSLATAFGCSPPVGSAL